MGLYYAKVQIRHTAADAAGSAVWAMHVPAQTSGTYKNRTGLWLREINLHVKFDGTGAAAAVELGYDLWRFSVADPTTGSTVPRIKSHGAGQASSVIADANIQQKSGILTMTSVAYDTDAFAAISLPQVNTGGDTELKLQFSSWDDDHPFFLPPDDGLAIRVLTGQAAVIGLALTGYVSWQERFIT